MPRGKRLLSRVRKRRGATCAALAISLGLGGALLDAFSVSSAMAGGRGDRWDRGGGFRSRDRDDDDDRRGGGQSWGGGGNWSGGWSNGGGNISGGNSGGGWSNGGGSSGGGQSAGGGNSSGSSSNSNSGQGPSSNLASPSGQQQDQSGRGDRRDNDDNGQKGSGKATSTAADAADDAPPRTVLELFNRVFKAPAAPAASAAPVKRPDAGAHHGVSPPELRKWEAVVHRDAPGKKGRDLQSGPSKAPSAPVVKTAAAQSSVTVAKPKVRLPRGLGPVVVPELSEIKSKVLLGVDLGTVELGKLRELGFKELGSSDVGIGRVTELAVPEGYNALGARDLASRQLPGQAFTYSVRYHLVPEGMKPSGIPDEPFIAGNIPRPCAGDRCYGPQLVDWQSRLSSCAKGVKVGVVDTAVDIDHPALGRMRAKLGSFGSGSVASERVWHGTGVAALLAGATSTPTPGLIPDSEFLIADIFSDGEDGMPESDTVGLLRALHWLDRLGVNVVNLSISGVRDEAVEPVIADMSRRGVIFVAAAGNDGPSGKPSYPAAYKDFVIAVTAVNKSLVSYSNATHGDYIDVSAPGVRIWTALPNERMGYRSGTSFATPFVTSVMAAIYSSSPAKTKAALLHRLRREMQDLGPAGRDPIYGLGLLRAPKECAPPVALTTASIKAKAGGFTSAAAR